MRGNTAFGILLVGVVAGCDGTSTSTPGDPFSPARVASAATEHGATPMLAVAASGERILSWVAEDGAAHGELHVERTGAGGGVTRGVLRDPLGGIEPHGEAPPVVAAVGGGAVLALYTVGKDVGARFPASALRFARSDDGGITWSDPVSVNEGETFGSHNFHALLVGDSGTVYAAWLRSVRGESAVWLRASRDGGKSWDIARPVHEAPTCPCCRTGLALAPDGTLHASWRKIFPGDVRDVVVATSRDDGVTWDAPVRPRADGWVFPGCPHAGPSLKVGPDGVVHIAWWTGKSGEAGVWYARSTDRGTSWQAQPIAVGARSMPAHVQLALTGGGGVLVAWDDGLGERPTVRLRASADNGASFGSALTLSDPTMAATYPVVALAGDSVAVAWSQVSDSTHRAMLAARPDMANPGARMTLPRVGQQEVMVRTAAVADLLAPEN